MKKTTKSLLTTALILVVAGLILSLGSFIYAKICGIDIYGVEKKAHKPETRDFTLAKILEDSPESDFAKKLTSTEFTKVDLLSFVGKVEIVPTDGETHVTLTDATLDNITVQVTGSTLTIAEKDEVGFLGVYIGDKGFSYKGLRQIFGPGNSADTGKVMTLYLNRETVPEEISVRSSIGDISVSGIDVQNLTMHSFLGKMTVAGVNATKILVEKTFGTLSFENNVYISLSASVRFGKIVGAMPEAAGQSTVLDLWIGSCTVDTDAPLNRYKLTLTATVGSIRRNGESQGKNLQVSSRATNRITSSVLLGRISLNDGGQPIDAPMPEPETEEIATETAETAENAESQPS